jgi:protocatechuate 3,4-dioxygenase alpha subunit
LNHEAVASSINGPIATNRGGAEARSRRVVRVPGPAAPRLSVSAVRGAGGDRPMMQLTPFSTVGPFFKLLVRDREEGVDTLVTDATRGERITIEGRLLDGAGAPIDDGLIEIWQADAEGRYHHPQDARASSADPAFTGFGRAATGAAGRFVFHTIRPGAVPGPDGRPQAPHILVGVMARGVMSRCWTRLYFEDQPANAGDPVLQLVPAARRETLIARSAGEGHYRFDIVIQGENETVFFDA